MSDREQLVKQLRKVIEWVSERDHGMAVELDRVVHELEVLAGQPHRHRPRQSTALRTICPLCQRSVALLRSGKMRWHGSDPQCIGGGLTVEQAQPGITAEEAEQIKYAKYRAVRS